MGQDAETVALRLIKANGDNPRSIRKSKFEKLVLSILVFPKMLSLRPIVVDEGMTVLGGNMRLKALKSISKMKPEDIGKRLESSRDFASIDAEGKASLLAFWAKWLEAPSAPVVMASGLTTEERAQFVIKDNSSYGEWDMDVLANGWDAMPLSDWGVDLPDEWLSRANPQNGEDGDEGGDDHDDGDDEEFGDKMCSDVLYESDNDFDIPNLLLSGQAGRLEVPFAPWGADSRMRKGIATYHFYVDDYRFERIWKDPSKVLMSGCASVIEPNASLFDTTPVAFGLQQIYKKRWISRYFQECGIKVYADLNVSMKFYGYNRMGIPKGYNAFATRGYSDRIEYLKAEHGIAMEISGQERPNMIVYGGGSAVRRYCQENGLLYTEQFMQNSENNGEDQRRGEES